jgi:thiol-disulfide isomerase/thioredoxin
MTRIPRPSRAAFAALVILTCVAGRGRAADPAADLEAAADRYAGLRTFEIEGWAAVVQSGAAPVEGSQTSFRFAMAPGGRMHEEVRQGGQRLRNISNGSVTFTHLEPLNQWMSRQRVPPAADSLRTDLSPGSPGAMIGSLLFTLRTTADSVASVHALPAETLEVNGARMPCTVLEVTYARTPQPGHATEGPRRVWISNGAIVEMQASFAGTGDNNPGAVQITRFTRVRLGDRPADSLFAFTPPADAKRVRQFQMPGHETVDLTGTRAADFTLKDLKGITHNLAKLRGKVVMLDFWASWCGPCRMTMPVVDKLTREFKTKGLVVFSVNLRESADVAGGYMKKNGYAMQTLLDTDGAVAGRYQVSGIPSLVIVDRKGVIRAHLVGAHGEDDLRDALAEAGL